MSISYDGFTINTETSPPPWGGVEEQYVKDSLDTLVKDTVTKSKNVSGHNHYHLLDTTSQTEQLRVHENHVEIPSLKTSSVEEIVSVNVDGTLSKGGSLSSMIQWTETTHGINPKNRTRVAIGRTASDYEGALQVEEDINGVNRVSLYNPNSGNTAQSDFYVKTYNTVGQFLAFGANHVSDPKTVQLSCSNDSGNIIKIDNLGGGLIKQVSGSNVTSHSSGSTEFNHAVEIDGTMTTTDTIHLLANNKYVNVGANDNAGIMFDGTNLLIESTGKIWFDNAGEMEWDNSIGKLKVSGITLDTNSGICTIESNTDIMELKGPSTARLTGGGDVGIECKVGMVYVKQDATCEGTLDVHSNLGCNGNINATGDNLYVTVGASSDAGMKYDGNNLIIDCRIVGTGALHFDAGGKMKWEPGANTYNGKLTVGSSNAPNCLVVDAFNSGIAVNMTPDGQSLFQLGFDNEAIKMVDSTNAGDVTFSTAVKLIKVKAGTDSQIYYIRCWRDDS